VEEVEDRSFIWDSLHPGVTVVSQCRTRPISITLQFYADVTLLGESWGGGFHSLDKKYTFPATTCIDKTAHFTNESRRRLQTSSTKRTADHERATVEHSSSPDDNPIIHSLYMHEW